MAMTWLRIGRVTSNNKELVGDHPLLLQAAAEAGEGHQASSRKGQRKVEDVDGVVAEVADEVEKAQKEE